MFSLIFYLQIHLNLNVMMEKLERLESLEKQLRLWMEEINFCQQRETKISLFDHDLLHLSFDAKFSNLTRRLTNNFNSFDFEKQFAARIKWH